MRISSDVMRHGSVVLSVTMTLCTGAAYAQTDALEEITVTAERRSENIQKTAASVSVRSGDDLLAQGKYSLANILEDVPGVTGGAAESTLTSLGGGTDTAGAGITIRGIGSSQGVGGTTTSTAAATAIYVDGVYEGAGSDYDIERVEVLRGPQGTLYGRSATAGVVAVHTRNPTLDEFGGDASVEAGNYDLQHYTAALNAPLVTDVLGLRISGNRYQRDGYYNGAGGALDNTDGRVKLLYQPNTDLSVLVGVALQDITDHSGGRTPADAYINDPNAVGFVDRRVGEGKNITRQYWAEANWNVGWGTLTYLPALRTWNQHADVAPNNSTGGSQLERTPKDDFWTHEFRLASNPGSALIWQTGALYYKNDLQNFNSLVFDNGAHVFIADTTKSTTAMGIFGETTYPFTDRLRLTTGIRYDYTKVQVAEDYTANTTLATDPASGGLPENLVTATLSPDLGTQKFHNWTYKVRLENDVAPANLLYASVATSFSPGDVSLTTCAPDNTPCPVVLAAETVTAYEVGTKNRFLGDSLQVNGAIFHYNYGGYQTAGINVSGNPNNPIFQTLAVPVKSDGLELEARYQITTIDRVGFNFAYTHARYVDKPEAFAINVANDSISTAVPITGNLSYEHVFKLPGGSNLTIHADGRYISSREITDVTQQQVINGAAQYADVKAAVVGNLNTTWSASGGRVSVTGYVRNVGDNRYFTNRTITTSGNFGALPRNQWTFDNTQYDPRTYGVVLNVRF
jgi:outer membrane receptor protein involved in Fe transport